VSEDFTIKLEEVFHGPMDLLLHLVREQEVEIHEIQINRVVDGFVAYIKQLESLDIELASDFVVMAATLMAIKSRSLLPHEEVNLEDELDPRDELIQRLVEYRRFREASEGLGERFRTRGLVHGRGWRGEVREHEEEPMLDLGELTRWDLLETFSRLQRETAMDRRHHVVLDHRPMRFYVERMVDRLRTTRASSLKELVGPLSSGEDAEALIGSFCALLELVKLQLVDVDQEQSGSDIAIRLREEAVADLDDVIRHAGFSDEAEPPDEDTPAPDAAPEGQAGEEPSPN